MERLVFSRFLGKGIAIFGIWIGSGIATALSEYGFISFLFAFLGTMVVCNAN